MLVVAQAEEVGDELLIPHGEADLPEELLAGAPPTPSWCGRLAYKPCQIMRICAVPSIKKSFF
jgi:hypothetical protein